MNFSRESAWELLTQYTTNPQLIKHALAVEAAMRAYAKKFGEDEDTWGITGLLHDFDYDAFPDLGESGHPYKGNEILTELGYPEEIRTAIMGHAPFTGVTRETVMAKTLFAVDELCGFVMAVAYVRPGNLVGMTSKSVKKKMKDKSFAAAVSRDEMRQAAEELGVDFDEHVMLVIEALASESRQLGFE